MAKATKEVKVKDAVEKAESAKSKDECIKAILEEAFDIESGKTHSVQQLMAYVRRYQKLDRK